MCRYTYMLAMRAALLFFLLWLFLAGCTVSEEPVNQGAEKKPAAEKMEQTQELEKETCVVKEKPQVFPGVSLSSAFPAPGDHLLIQIRNLDYLPEVSLASELEGELSQPYWDKNLACLMLGISYYNEPGEYSLTLEISGENGKFWEKTKEINVVEGNFSYQEFSVPSVRTEDWSMERLQEEREKLMLARKNTAPEQLWCGPFKWPLEGNITSDFGAVRVINEGEPRRHSGIDIAAPTGTQLASANCGEVRLAEHLLASGKTVIVDHGLGLSSAYLHMHKIKIEEGQVVEKGEVIGTVGETGFATGPHLHWSVYIGQTPVSPYGFMDEY